MSETTIPVRLLIEQFTASIALAENMANMSADLCRKNKIDWLDADNEMWSRQSEIDTVHSTIWLALFSAGLTESIAELNELRSAAKERIATLRLDLRTNCLLNGPLAPKSQPFSGRIDPYTDRAQHVPHSTPAAHAQSSEQCPGSHQCSSDHPRPRPGDPSAGASPESGPALQ